MPAITFIIFLTGKISIHMKGFFNTTILSRAMRSTEENEAKADALLTLENTFDKVNKINFHYFYNITAKTA